MLLHKPSVYFPTQLEIQIPCRNCRNPFLIKDGICYEGFVVSETHDNGTAKSLLYVKVVLCSLKCVTDVACPAFDDKWEVIKH